MTSTKLPSVYQAILGPETVEARAAAKRDLDRHSTDVCACYIFTLLQAHAHELDGPAVHRGVVLLADLAERSDKALLQTVLAAILDGILSHDAEVESVYVASMSSVK